MALTAIRHRTRAAAGVATVAAALALPATGLAHTLSLSKARSAAAVQAQKIKRDTEAQSSAVSSCARKTSHKVLGKVRSRYSVGLKTCITDVTVYYASHSSTRPKALIGRSACS